MKFFGQNCFPYKEMISVEFCNREIPVVNKTQLLNDL